MNDAIPGAVRTFGIMKTGVHTGRYNGTLYGGGTIYGGPCLTAAVTYYDSKTRAKMKKWRKETNVHNRQNQNRLNKYRKLLDSFHILAGPKKLGKDFLSHFRPSNTSLDSVRIDFVVHDSTKQ